MGRNDVQGRVAGPTGNPFEWLGGSRGTAIIFLTVASWFVVALVYVLLTTLADLLPSPLPNVVLAALTGVSKLFI